MLSDTQISELFSSAVLGLCNSYSPYSDFQVGAALLCADGTIYSGTNVENAGIMSICGERCAVVKAVSEGRKDFQAILVIGKPKDSTEYIECTPCGYCRQLLAEFVGDDFPVYYMPYAQDINVAKPDFVAITLGELLPHAFRGNSFLAPAKGFA